jgi:phage shock protein A
MSDKTYGKYLGVVPVRTPLEAMVQHKKELEQLLEEAQRVLESAEKNLVQRRLNVEQLITAIAQADEACHMLDTPSKVESLSSHRSS